MKRKRPWRLEVYLLEQEQVRLAWGKLGWSTWGTYARFETAMDRLLAIQQWNGKMPGIPRQSYRILHTPSGVIHMSSDILEN